MIQRIVFVFAVLLSLSACSHFFSGVPYFPWPLQEPDCDEDLPKDKDLSKDKDLPKCKDLQKPSTSLETLSSKLEMYNTAYLKHAAKLRKQDVLFGEAGYLAFLVGLYFGTGGQPGTGLASGAIGGGFLAAPKQLSHPVQAANYERASAAIACLQEHMFGDEISQVLDTASEDLLIHFAESKLKEVKRRLHLDQANLDAPVPVSLNEDDLMTVVGKSIELKSEQKELEEKIKNGEGGSKDTHVQLMQTKRTLWELSLKTCVLRFYGS